MGILVFSSLFIASFCSQSMVNVVLGLKLQQSSKNYDLQQITAINKQIQLSRKLIAETELSLEKAKADTVRATNENASLELIAKFNRTEKSLSDSLKKHRSHLDEYIKLRDKYNSKLKIDP